MGCASNSSTQSILSHTNLLGQKPKIWMIAGGPGSKKNKVCQYIVRDYKMKYLSGNQILQFEKDRNGPDAQIIKQLILKNQQLPSKLVARLVKKAIASCGLRRFIIDDFPRNIQDVKQFDKIIPPKDIIIQKYIYVDASKDMMIKSGLQAKNQQNNKEDTLKVITNIVNGYINDVSNILTEFQRRNKLWKFSAQKGPDQVYKNLRFKFSEHGLNGPQNIIVFFSRFSNPKDQNSYCDDLIQKYGLFFYTASGLIAQIKQKKTSMGQFARQCQKNKKQIPSQFVLELIKKKIQKHDYKGKYLISGYPRTIGDIQQWQKMFGWETDVKGYINFEIQQKQFKQIFIKKIKDNLGQIKIEDLQKKYQKYKNIQKQVQNYYKDQKKLLTVNCNNTNQKFKDIDQFFTKNSLQGRINLNPNLHIVFMSTISSDGKLYTQYFNQNHKIKIIHFNNLLNVKIQQGGLYSQLIDTYNKIGKPIPGFVAARVLMQNLCQLGQGRIIVKGFPNSSQQLSIWQQQIGLSIKLYNIIFFETDKKYITQSIKKLIKQKKLLTSQIEAINYNIKNSQELQQRLISSDWNYNKVKIQDSFQISCNFIKKDLEQSQFLKRI